MSGLIEFEIINEVIIVAKVSGSIHEQETNSFYSDFRKLVLEQPGRFAIVMELSEFEGTSPEGFKQAELFNQWLLDKPIIAKVNVVNSGIMQSIVNKEIPTRQKLNLKDFNTLQQAVEYLMPLFDEN